MTSKLKALWVVFDERDVKLIDSHVYKNDFSGRYELFPGETTRRALYDIIYKSQHKKYDSSAPAPYLLVSNTSYYFVGPPDFDWNEPHKVFPLDALRSVRPEGTQLIAADGTERVEFQLRFRDARTYACDAVVLRYQVNWGCQKWHRVRIRLDDFQVCSWREPPLTFSFYDLENRRRSQVYTPLKVTWRMELAFKGEAPVPIKDYQVLPRMKLTYQELRKEMEGCWEECCG